MREQKNWMKKKLVRQKWVGWRETKCECCTLYTCNTISVIHLRALRETTCFRTSKTTTATAKIRHLEAHTRTHTYTERACTQMGTKDREYKRISYRNYSLTIDRLVSRRQKQPTNRDVCWAANKCWLWQFYNVYRLAMWKTMRQKLEWRNEQTLRHGLSPHAIFVFASVCVSLHDCQHATFVEFVRSVCWSAGRCWQRCQLVVH